MFSLSKNDIYFTLLLLFIVKLVLLPVGFPDAAVLLVLLAYRPVSQFLKLQRDVKISEKSEQEIELVRGEISEVRKNLESLKIAESIKQQFGVKK